MSQVFSIDAGASEQELLAVQEVIDQFAFEGEVEANYVRMSSGVLPWIAVITLPVAAFLSKLGMMAAEDAYNPGKAFVKGLVAARNGRSDGQIVVGDRGPDSDGTVLVLSPGLPDEAWRQLFELDLECHVGDYLVWSADRGWHDASS